MVEDLKVGRNLSDALNPRHMTLMVMPTEKCNFRCTYCYEDFKIGKMPRSKILAIKMLIDKRSEDLKTFNLSWFGGEPLLAKDIIFELSAYAQEVCATRGVRFIRGNVTTNGYLLDQATLQALTAVRQNIFQISLDGWEEGHDVTRRMVSGAGTFHRIWANIVAMRRSDLEFSAMLRVHLTPQNINSAERLLDEIVDLLKGDPRFAVLLKPVGDWGGPNSGNISALSRSAAAAEVKRLTLRLKDLETVDAEGGADPGDFYICYAAKPNTLLIRANGGIAKCTVALAEDINDIGKLNDDGTITFHSERLNRWFLGYRDMSEKTLGCPLSSVRKAAKDKGALEAETLALGGAVQAG